MKNGTLQYIHNQFKSFRINFIRSSASINFDYIHDYRVSLKRIRAISKFISKIPGSKNLRIWYKICYLADLYNAGGKIREIQINRQILQKFENDQITLYKGFKKYLNIKDWWAVRVLKAIRYLYSYRRIKNYEDRLKAAIHLIPDEEFLTFIDTFIQNKIKEIELLVTDHDVESKLHKIRKYIKSIKYLFEMLQINNREFGNIHFEIDRITILEDTIGNWHDYYEFRAELEEYIRISGKRDKKALSLKKNAEKEYNLKYQEAVQVVYKSFKIKSNGIL